MSSDKTKEESQAFIQLINNKSINGYQLLYDRYYRAVVSYTMTLVNQQDIAEDIVQEVIVAIWEKNLQFTNEYTLKAYLYNSVKNRAINYLNRQHIENNYLASLQNKNEEFTEIDTEAFEEEIYHQLFEIINELPKRRREIFLLYLEGRKNEEIAQALTISAETVKTQKKRALSYIRGRILPFYFFCIFLDKGF